MAVRRPQTLHHDDAMTVLFDEMRPIQLKYLQSVADLSTLQGTAAKALVSQVEENEKLARPV